ncbi:hypothetical protein EV182_004914, partial [Spiromyces aspiralis]
MPAPAADASHERSAAHLRSVVLDLRVVNKSMVQLQDVALELMFSNRGACTDSMPSLSVIECMDVSNEDGQQQLFEMGLIAATGNGFRTTSKHFQLCPNVPLNAKLVIGLDTPRQLDGRVRVSFPSPGTGTPLVVEHEFGVYLLHQFPCEVIDPAEMQQRYSKYQEPAVVVSSNDTEQC